MDRQACPIGRTWQTYSLKILGYSWNIVECARICSNISLTDGLLEVVFNILYDTILKRNKILHSFLIFIH
jgi:hypothetical protein